jgi:hypothetical protein
MARDNGLDCRSATGEQAFWSNLAKVTVAGLFPVGQSPLWKFFLLPEICAYFSPHETTGRFPHLLKRRELPSCTYGMTFA